MILRTYETYEQISLNDEIISNIQEKFLIENLIVKVESYEDNPISIRLPETINLKVVETDAVIKGQTATSGLKPAILENGVKVMVPLHIKKNMKIVVKTSDNSYVEKVK